MMEDLVRHLVEPIVEHPEAVSIQKIEGEAAIMLELVVHPDDRDRIADDKNKTLRSIRTILSAAAGRQAATLDLVEAHGQGAEE